MTNRVITVTVDGKTVTVNGNDPARVLNVGPPGAAGVDGVDGADGAPGADGDTFVPDPAAEPDDRWLKTLGGALVYTDTPEGGGGAVDSVNGQTGVVVLDADDLADGTTNHVFTAADDTKLAGVASGATANDTDANLKARVNHTGVQAISTVTGLQTALDGKETAGAAAAAQAASQPVDSDLTAIAALSTTTYGRSVLATADAAALRTLAGLGTAALISSTAGGDLSGTLPSPTVAKVNGVAVTGTPSVGYVPTATSSTAATWQAASGGGGSSVGSTLYLFNNYS